MIEKPDEQITIYAVQVPCHGECGNVVVAYSKTPEAKSEEVRNKRLLCRSCEELMKYYLPQMCEYVRMVSTDDAFDYIKRLISRALSERKPRHIFVDESFVGAPEIIISHRLDGAVTSDNAKRFPVNMEAAKRYLDAHVRYRKIERQMGSKGGNDGRYTKAD